MVDSISSNKRRKRTISESDIATLLQRYDATTILRLLQEMAFYADVKMDWNELVKKTATGITNAREYQMLWRHLSYRDPLLLPVDDDDAQPLDDDSDIECELEASPPVSVEASVEAIAHVKVLAASYVPRESDVLDESTSEAPLTINIPYTLPHEPSDSPWLSRGMNITFPVCLQKPTPTATEGINGDGSASISMASRKIRKRWSAEEDADLIAAVKRCGEGNWAHIARGEFRGRRTASQLSQRWPHLRKKYDTSTSGSQPGVQQTEAQIAVNHALSLALGNRPPSKKVAVGTQGNGGRPSQGQQQSKPVAVQTLSRAATTVPASKSRLGVKKTTASSTFRSDLMVTANSAAAAACMGGVSTGPSVPKVESVENASTACMPCPSGSLVVPEVEPGKTVAASSITKPVGPANARPLANGNLKPVTPSPSSVIPPLTDGSTLLSASTHLTTASKIVSSQRVSAASVPATVLPPKATAGTAICKPDGGHKEQAREDGASSLVAIQSNNMISTNSETSRGKQAAAHAQTAVLGAANQSLVDKTAVPSISGAGSKSKAKCEVNNNVGSLNKVSNACGEPTEVANVRGTGQGV
ncbi:Homeodomain-like superfamily protein [Raphanus sativus]|uniref:Uncharacterized protein LOC108862637 n=1 Tax=Raphanus sativus TaxID=3726 RepID=A0A6J0P6T5_RAPSA|nr:uncharacterized protein LOC108862637 [Raphanus sativus]KAJ4914963.1 Homeodomain-like superfamily protein [Raphanus sativus]